jgi:hypothetical protein
MNAHHDSPARTLSASWMAVRSDQLQHDRHQQGPERPGRRLDHMRVAQLLVAFEQREQRAQGEQHDSHQEGPEVAFAPETEGMRGRGRLTPPPAPEREQSLIAGVGHRVDRLGQHRGAPVNRNATNLAIAIPRLARNAAKIARVLPSFTPAVRWRSIRHGHTRPW